MAADRPPVLVPICLVLGALLGLAGSFSPTPSLRGLAWGLDGTLLVLAAAMLIIHCLRLQADRLAAGFLVFMVGQTLVLSGSAMSLEASGPLFGAGAGLWATALILISLPKGMPTLARVSGLLAAMLFALTALQILAGRALTPLSEPLPFLAYPVFVLTLLQWAWWCRQPAR